MAHIFAMDCLTFIISILNHTIKIKKNPFDLAKLNDFRKDVCILDQQFSLIYVVIFTIYQGSKLEAAIQVPMAPKGRKTRHEIYDCI